MKSSVCNLLLLISCGTVCCWGYANLSSVNASKKEHIDVIIIGVCKLILMCVAFVSFYYCHLFIFIVDDFFLGKQDRFQVLYIFIRMYVIFKFNEANDI